MKDRDKSKTTIILVHGIGAGRVFMWLFARRLRRCGYNVINWGYRSLLADLELHAKRLAGLFDDLADDAEVESICLIGHSMGAIVGRAALQISRPEKLKSMVLLTPPNQGSPVADRLAPFLGWVSRPALQLRTATDSYVNRLPKTLPVPCGVIAAKLDWIVPLPLTHIDDLADHAVANGIHSLVVYRKDVVRWVDRFVCEQTFGVERDQTVSPISEMPSQEKWSETAC
jgi:pimeloyl-ACP methyl ester carboxylesterase